MNKVITINLGGNAYQLEEGGYDALRAYLENAAGRLQGNPDRDEIISDIERAIADKFRSLLGPNKSVVEQKEVAAVISEMGPIEADPGDTSAAGGAAAGAGPSAPGGGAGEGTRAAGVCPPPKRLYRIHDGAMFAGVCNGFAAYFGVDPTFVRLGFIVLTIFWGMGLLLYLVMAFVIPEARSAEEKAAATGAPFTSQEFIRRAKEGYYGAMKDFPDKKARREWRRRFKREMRGWRTSFESEMSAHAEQWRHNWHGYWGQHFPPHPGMAFTLPFLSLLQGVVTVLWFCALISLLAHGNVLGLALPMSVPVWAAAVILFFIYGMISAPLKIARKACYWSYGGAGGGPFLYLADAVVWVAFAVVVLWLVAHYFPELQEAIRSLPGVFHQAVDDIKLWWQTK